MNKPLLQGDLVRLVAQDASSLAETYSRWSDNSEFSRLMDSNIARPHSVKDTRRGFEEFLEKDPSENLFFFTVHTLAEDRLIGDVDLGGVRWAHGDTFVGIGLGEPEFWGRGYGTDAMRIILRYAFEEMNLRRVTLNVFEYNPRAIRSYEKAGFRCEGRIRQGLLREGRRWDMIYMGILREEWQALQENEENE